MSDMLSQILNSHYLPEMWVDATPDQDYVIRILRAYLKTTNSRIPNTTGDMVSFGDSENLPELLQAINRAQEQRAEYLRQAIAILEAAPPATPAASAER